MEINENNIVAMLKQGEEKAYRYLFEHHYSVLCHIADSIVHDKFLAEDIVCEVFFNIYQMRDSFNVHSSLKGYLVTAVRNRAMNALNHIKRNSHSPMDEVSENIVMDQDDIIAKNELEKIISDTICDMPENRRLVFEKSRFEGKKYEEIANDLGISVNTVKYHIKNALSSIRKDIDKHLS